MKKLKKYKLSLSGDMNDKTGLTSISLVESPAIGVNFIAFSQEEPESQEIRFSADEDRHLITGPVLIPGLDIERVKPTPRVITIDADMIERTWIKYIKTGKVGNINLQHQPLQANDTHIFEMFMSDESRGIKAPAMFSDLPDRTIYVTMYTENQNLWSEIKSGKYNGFSIEGLYNEFEVEFSKQDTLTPFEIFSEIKNIFNEL